jgi:hypothetical protein
MLKVTMPIAELPPASGAVPIEVIRP